MDAASSRLMRWGTLRLCCVFLNQHSLQMLQDNIQLSQLTVAAGIINSFYHLKQKHLVEYSTNFFTQGGDHKPNMSFKLILSSTLYHKTWNCNTEILSSHITSIKNCCVFSADEVF